MCEKIIAICTANFYTETSRDMINSISKACEEIGYSVWVFNAFTDFNYEEINDTTKESIFDLLESASFSAVVILTPTIQNQATIQRINAKAQALQIPVISYEMKLDGCYNILFDYEQAFSAGVEHLIEQHGCRKINMIAGFRGNTFSEERVTVYKRVLQKYGIPVEEERIGYGDFWEGPAMEVMQNFIDREEELPDAVVCANDTMAMAACRVLERNGYSVPSDILITGFDGIDVEKHHFPRLTTARRNYDQAGKCIAKIAKNYYEKQENCPETIMASIHNVFSQSCGCVCEEIRNINEIIVGYQSKLNTRIWDDYVLNNLSVRGEGESSLSKMLSQFEETLAYWNFPFFQLFLKKDRLKNREYFPNNVSAHDTMEFEMQHENGTGKAHLKAEEVILAIQWDAGEFLVPLKQEKHSAEDFRKYPIVVFSPVHEQNQLFGYSTASYMQIDDTDAHRLFKFVNHIGHMLAIEESKERLYQLNRELYEKNMEIEALYIRDPLTKIFNRRGFQQTLYPMLRDTRHSYLMIASLDLDGLKYINDTFGHKDGDFALCSFTEILKSLCGKDDFCARFGGDEFVYVSFTDDKNAGEVFQEQLYAALDELAETLEKPYRITGSCGCCIVKAEQDVDADVVLQKADTLMYEQKRKRKK